MAFNDWELCFALVFPWPAVLESLLEYPTHISTKEPLYNMAK